MNRILLWLIRRDWLEARGPFADARGSYYLTLTGRRVPDDNWPAWKGRPKLIVREQ